MHTCKRVLSRIGSKHQRLPVSQLQQKTPLSAYQTQLLFLLSNYANAVVIELIQKGSHVRKVVLAFQASPPMYILLIRQAHLQICLRVLAVPDR